MKKTAIFLLIAALLLSPCACVESTTVSTAESSEPQQSEESSKPFVSTISIDTVLQTYDTKNISTNASEITDDEAFILASKLYFELVDIAKEFYGFPYYLNYEMPEGGISASQLPYHSKVIEISDPKNISDIKFKNDVNQINSVLEKYLSKDFIALAFNLEEPCPIYLKDGELYRTSYEPLTMHVAADLKAGRILSREKGIVRYAYPVYFINYDTHVPEPNYRHVGDNVLYNYVDFVYENGIWKANDFRFCGPIYNSTHFPAGKAKITADDFFGAKQEADIEGVRVVLSEGTKAEITISGTTLSSELKNKSAKIKEIKKSGDNIFVTFTGVLGNDETIVISESKKEIISQFLSQGFCTKDDEWYYLKLDSENYLCDLLDKNGTAIHGFGVVRYKSNTAEGYSLYEIASIASVELIDNEFKVTFETVAENAEKDK